MAVSSTRKKLIVYYRGDMPNAQELANFGIGMEPGPIGGESGQSGCVEYFHDHTMPRGELRCERTTVDTVTRVRNVTPPLPDSLLPLKNLLTLLAPNTTNGDHLLERAIDGLRKFAYSKATR